MKIEKINEYQIRCTLTKDDMVRRGIQVSDLSYGTEKAKELFKDMMEEAAESYNFTADDMPVMVEAIPVNSDCMVLVVTLCEDPEELDTRFASFTPNVFYDENGEYEDDDDEDDDDFSSIFSRIQEGGMSNLFNNELPSVKKIKTRKPGKPVKYTDSAEYRVFSFPLLMDVISVSKKTDKSYKGKNTLYQNKIDNNYILILHRASKNDKVFANVCLLLSEYGKEERIGTAKEQFMNEHGSVIIADKALQTLRKQ